MDISLGALDRAIEDETVRFEAMREIAKIMARDLNQTSNLPVVSTELFRLISRRTRNPDPFRIVKDECNRIARPIAQKIGEEILKTGDPEFRLRSAVLASIAGNTMDLGTSGHSFNLEGFQEDFQRVAGEGLSIDDTQSLLQLIERAKTMIFLADNAGEIAFDKILVRVISEMGTSVMVAVKGGPISNDATLDDAKFVGMEEVAEVITTGTDHLGVNFQESSKEFLETFQSSDLVLSKGQSNFETLSYDSNSLGQPVAYVLKAKCLPIAEALGVGLGANVLKVVCPP